MAMIPYMAAGFAVDKLMGGNGMTGLALGTGVGSAGGFGALGEAIGGATAATSGGASTLGSGAALMGGGSTAATGGATALQAANTFPTLLSSTGALSNGSAATTGLGTLSTVANPMAGMSPAANFNLGVVNPATTGGLSEGISAFTPDGISGTVGGNTGLFGQATSNQALNSALTADKGLLNTALENTGLDFVGNSINFVGNKAQEGLTDIDKTFEDMSNMEKVQSAMVASNVGLDDTQNKIQANAPRILPGKPIGTGVTSANLAINRAEPGVTFGVPREEELQMRSLLGRR